MNQKTRTAAIEGWYTLDNDKPSLIGSQCSDCHSYFFPKQSSYCKNPTCESTEFSDVELSRTGKIWSYTNNCYQPPEPYISADPFKPYAIAAVELEKERMTVLGQVVEGVDVDQLKVGMEVELVVETLYEDEETDKVVWKWKPIV
jgi:uncharacterized OB-fold protein